MKVHYRSTKVETKLGSKKALTKEYGDQPALEILKIINLLEAIPYLNDIKNGKRYRVHSLENKDGVDYHGHISISVPSSALRMIVIPLDSSGEDWDGNEELKMYASFESLRIMKVEDYHD